MVDARISAFRDWLVSEYRSNATWERVEALKGADAPEGGMSVRLHLVNRSYYEVRVPEAGDQLQVGLGTESRMVNEAIEQMVLDNGGDLSELLSDELCDLGEQPGQMEHFFERPAFRYVVRRPITVFDQLENELRSWAKTVLKACRILFQECVDEAV